VWEYERFITTLAARAPKEVRRGLLEYVLNAYGETELYREDRNVPVPSEGHRMSFATHSLASFLHSTVQARSFGEALCACYAVGICWMETRSLLANASTHPSPLWPALTEIWKREDFAPRIQVIKGSIDRFAETASDDSRERMVESFGACVHYMLRFWDGIMEESDW
jgi:thiaminase